MRLPVSTRSFMPIADARLRLQNNGQHLLADRLLRMTQVVELPDILRQPVGNHFPEALFPAVFLSRLIVPALEFQHIQHPIHLKMTLTAREAAEYSNIGINKIDSMLRTPNCPFVLFVGAKKLVKRKEFEQFISEKLVI